MRRYALLPNPLRYCFAPAEPLRASRPVHAIAAYLRHVLLLCFFPPPRAGGSPQAGAARGAGSRPYHGGPGHQPPRMTGALGCASHEPIRGLKRCGNLGRPSHPRPRGFTVESPHLLRPALSRAPCCVVRAQLSAVTPIQFRPSADMYLHRPFRCAACCGRS